VMTAWCSVNVIPGSETQAVTITSGSDTRQPREGIRLSGLLNIEKDVWVERACGTPAAQRSPTVSTTGATGR
jgi:hypothetical protein